MASGQLQWVLTSPLTGMGIALPAPLNKAERSNWSTSPLRVEVTGLGTEAGQEREQIDLQLGRLVQARLVRNTNSGEVLAGAVGIGTTDAPPLPRRGVDLSLVTDRLDLDEWRELLPTTPTPAGAAATGTSSDTASALLPERIRVNAKSVMIMGRQLQEVSALASPLRRADTSGGWRVELEASQLAGRIDWQPAPPGRRDGHALVTARLTRLSIPPAAAETVEDLSTGDDGVEWPALDIVVDDFELRGRRLGRLELKAEAERAGRDWQLSRLVLTNADGTLSASGSWGAVADSARPGPVRPAETPRRTSMDFELDVRDSGALLTRMGWGEALRGGAGRVAGQLAWRGSPFSPNVRTMQGQMTVDVRSGQFLKADAGAARLLGVLSLQSLPRRLVLDFRDVFQEGFPFDSFTGDVAILAGVASTNNLRMRGIQAAVLMEGNADLQNETQDLRVLVVPEINAGTASLAYATINPALGLGTFLAQLFLRRPLMAANTREFRITGNWVDPKVERLQRSTPLSNEEVERAVAPASPNTRRTP
jgi:uncharacterized protein YhdP